MNFRKYPIIFGIVMMIVIMAMDIPDNAEIVKLKYPVNWPKPAYDFNKNPLTKSKVELGRKLFYDPILSQNNTISCSSCHSSYTAFTHVDHDLSHGINDSIGTRNSAVLINLAWNTSFMWDGGVNHIDVQALAPITHPSEMGEDLLHVESKLQASEVYSQLFAEAFGSKKITGQNILKALAQFQLTLVSANSKYDQVMLRAENINFTEQELSGYDVFKTNCSSCHTEPLFTNGSFENNGLELDKDLKDLGRMKITHDKKDSLKFKVPTLRNIEFSFPYMHDGRFESLNQAINHYNNGLIESKTLSEKLKSKMNLTEHQRVDLLAFLLTLTDKEFLFNPNFAYPRN
jgi:cytochrome c peroxidase